ncbi:hypothetical protein K450DRAFT_220918 [Umbelopsis ramanniana AG]|uniref:HD/PDEase domain-containing protein n=1 Tax=Umbelopsis ramanniana AG TaxID=1314678 RepID=A0AAD5EIE7_UMBRA|nr:uncharacterized protein K450DRAFT_220918 [Umbelopsis ramanniana AG]KAI8583987.1 hypothetical protein K450DRAFT_220918 [Umbelopsis ramanniana AG]
MSGLTFNHNIPGNLSYDHLNYGKIFNDPIHGHIRLDDVQMQFADTVQFQRLRELKQLGACYYVFPGASHNRFEHSLGVSYLAAGVIEHFKENQPELHITQDEIDSVKIAGLCHDLGHGPYSHLFDNEFMPLARPHKRWTHEEASEMMLEYLIDDNYIDIDRHQINFIKDLIAGVPKSTSQANDRAFLFDIVANKRNSLDVDKFDYIERDCYNLGAKSSYDAKRLMWFSRVIDNQICYHEKEVYNLYEIFHTRYSLFKQMYTHRKAKAVECMITDILVAADPFLKISESVEDPKKFWKLTDGILKTIEHSEDDELKDARQIIKRLRTRKLYRFVDEFLIPAGMESHITKDKISARELVSYQSDNSGLVEEDVIIEWLVINYAMKDRNPMDSVRFFSKRHQDQGSFTIPKQQVSSLVPSQFQEINIRVFARNPEKSKEIRKAFYRMMRTYNLNEQLKPDIESWMTARQNLWETDNI